MPNKKFRLVKVSFSLLRAASESITRASSSSSPTDIYLNRIYIIAKTKVNRSCCALEARKTHVSVRERKSTLLLLYFIACLQKKCNGMECPGSRVQVSARVSERETPPFSAIVVRRCFIASLNLRHRHRAGAYFIK
jgi:hypothetical protein